jgi:VanZ family protein
VLKKQVFLLTLIYTTALTVVCLIKINKLPSLGVSFTDKIYHFLAYTVLAFLWYSTFLFKFKFEKSKALIYASIFSIIFGIIIEVLQGVLTVYRAADFYDVVANTSGVLFVVIILLLKNRVSIKKQ